RCRSNQSQPRGGFHASGSIPKAPRLRYDPRRMARGLPSKADILNALEEAGRPLHAGQLATRCEVSQTAYPKFLEALETMAERNQVRRLSGPRLAANPVKEAPKPTDQGEGVLALNPRGFGFVTSPGKEDVYVPPDAIGAALHGDRVVVSVINR